MQEPPDGLQEPDVLQEPDFRHEPGARPIAETHAAHPVQNAILHVDITLDVGNEGVSKSNAPRVYSRRQPDYDDHESEVAHHIDVGHPDDDQRSISPAYSDLKDMDLDDDGRYHSRSPLPSPVYSEYGEDEVVPEKIVHVEKEGENHDDERDEVVNPLILANPANPILVPSAVDPNLNPIDDPEIPIDEPVAMGVSQRRQSFLLSSVQRSLYGTNMSNQQRTAILDTLAMSLLLFGAPANLVRQLSTVHRLNTASEDPNYLLPIHSYSHCKKCDQLKLIEWVDDCTCRKTHSNLIVHKLDGDGVIKKTSSVVCGFDKAPKANLVKPCSQELAVDAKGTGKFEPGRQIHFANITDWIHSVYSSPTIQDDLCARFQFEVDRPQPGGSNFTCEYMTDFMKILPEGSLSRANWQNLMLFFNCDWFGKSKNIHGHDAHLGGLYAVIVNLLPGQQHHPKFVFQYCQMEGKEPGDMSPIMDRLYTEMRKLAKDGTLVTLFDGQKLLVRAFPWEMISDGEARAKVAGWKSKNHRMPCMYCMWCPLRGEHKMHAIFNMTEEDLIDLHNGKYDRVPTFDLKKYMREWMNATTMIERNAMEQETGMEYSTLYKLIDVCDIRRFFGPDGMHVFGGIFFNLCSLNM